MPAKMLCCVVMFGCLLWFSLSVQAGDFYAYYTKVNSNEAFEQYSRTGDYADIIINFEEMNGKLVFWRGSSYLPYWETDQGKWFVEELIQRNDDKEETERQACLRRQRGYIFFCYSQLFKFTAKMSKLL